MQCLHVIARGSVTLHFQYIFLKGKCINVSLRYECFVSCELNKGVRGALLKNNFYYLNIFENCFSSVFVHSSLRTFTLVLQPLGASLLLNYQLKYHQIFTSYKNWRSLIYVLIIVLNSELLIKVSELKTD